MTPFEEELKKALTPRQPSAGFTERVLEQLPAAKFSPRRSVPWRLAVAAAAALFIAGGTVYQQHERNVQGEAARHQLLLAMRIAGSKLLQVQQRVQQSEVNQ